MALRTIRKQIEHNTTISHSSGKSFAYHNPKQITNTMSVSVLLHFPSLSREPNRPQIYLESRESKLDVIIGEPFARELLVYRAKLLRLLRLGESVISRSRRRGRSGTAGVEEEAAEAVLVLSGNLELRTGGCLGFRFRFRWWRLVLLLLLLGSHGREWIRTWWFCIWRTREPVWRDRPGGSVKKMEFVFYHLDPFFPILMKENFTAPIRLGMAIF